MQALALTTCSRPRRRGGRGTRPNRRARPASRTLNRRTSAKAGGDLQISSHQDASTADDIDGNMAQFLDSQAHARMDRFEQKVTR